MKRVVAKNTGFALVEVMMSLGIMVIMSYSFMELIVNGQMEISKVERRVEMINLSNILSSRLRDETSCESLLKNTSGELINSSFSQSAAASTEGQAISIFMFGHTLSEGNFLPQFKLTFDKFRFKNAALISSDTTTGVKTFAGELVIKASTKVGTMDKDLGSKTLGEAVFHVDASNKVLSCNLSGISSGKKMAELDECPAVSSQPKLPTGKFGSVITLHDVNCSKRVESTFLCISGGWKKVGEVQYDHSC